METPLIHDWFSWIVWHVIILGVPLAICWAWAGWQHWAERRERKYFLAHTHGCGSRNQKGCTNVDAD